MLVTFLAIIVGLFNYLEHYYGHYVAFKILSQFRIMVYNKLRDIAPAKMDNKNSSKILSVIHTDIELVEVFFAHTIVPILNALTMSIVVGSIYIVNLGIYGMIPFVMYFLVGFVFPFFRKKDIKNHTDKIEINKDVINKMITEDINGKNEILEFNLLNSKLNNFLDSTKKELKIMNKIALIESSKDFIVNISILLSWFILFYITKGNVSEMGKILVIIYPFTFLAQLAISKLSVSLSTSLNSAKNLINFLDENSSVTDGEVEINDIESISFTNLKFGYEDNIKVLNDISAYFDGNNIIGIIGKSGSGKSTLMKLIMKWYEAKQGEVNIDNKNIIDISKNSIRKQITYVPQNPYIFNGTLRENLTLGKEYNDEYIYEKIKEASLEERFNKLENGLDTILKTNEIPFSSGELQRLELVRAFLVDKPIIIFDEPTSNLDLENEKIILNIIKQIKDKKIFIISHRKTTIDICDKVYSFKNGNLKELV